MADNMYGQQSAPSSAVPDVFDIFDRAVRGMAAMQEMRHREKRLPGEIRLTNAEAGFREAGAAGTRQQIDFAEQNAAIWRPALQRLAAYIGGDPEKWLKIMMPDFVDAKPAAEPAKANPASDDLIDHERRYLNMYGR